MNLMFKHLSLQNLFHSNHWQVFSCYSKWSVCYLVLIVLHFQLTKLYENSKIIIFENLLTICKMYACVGFQKLFQNTCSF